MREYLFSSNLGHKLGFDIMLNYFDLKTYVVSWVNIIYLLFVGMIYFFSSKFIKCTFLLMSSGQIPQKQL